MKDEKDLLLDNFFKEAAELQISDDGFAEQVMAALPASHQTETKAMKDLKKKMTLWNIACIASGIALFIVLKGWNIIYDIMASGMAIVLTTDFTRLLTNMFVVMLALPTLLLIFTAYFFGRAELSKRW